MKTFEMPEMLVEVFAIEDVITTSTEQGGTGGEYETDRD